jgi:hypothetical protein
MLRFTPYRGSHYEQGFRDGLKLLVLGESHYGEDRGEGMTIYWLNEHIKRNEESRTWRACEGMLAHCGSYKGSQIWDHVSFANFV